MTHLTRYQMYIRIGEFFKKESKGKVLCVSGAGPIANMFHPDSRIINVAYPEVDLQKLPYEDSSFDFVVTDQVLEHVENPFIAVDEMYRVLNNEGYMITLTCFMNTLHEMTTDFW